MIAALAMMACLWCRVHRLEAIVEDLSRDLREMEGGDAGRTSYISLTSDTRDEEMSQPRSPPRPSCSTPKAVGPLTS